jgi:single-strand DNA-binding protein
MIQTGTIVGRLGRDPEFKTTQAGFNILSCSVAVSLWKKQEGGEFGSSTQWWTVKVFGKQAEKLAGKLKKGSRVFASGDIEVRTYLKKDGAQGHSLEMSANILKGLDKDQAEQMNEVLPHATRPEQTTAEIDFGDLPF